MKRIVPAALLAGLILYNFISSNVYSQVVLAAVLGVKIDDILVYQDPFLISLIA